MRDSSILVVGETLVDFLPDESGPLTEIESFSRRSGGAPANVAVALSRLGHTPAFWTRVGDDPFGDSLRRVLKDNDVPETYVERDLTAKTALAFVSLDSDADREFSFYFENSASTNLEPNRIDDAALESTDWIHVGGVCFAFAPARDALFDLLDRASKLDVTVSFDPNARPELWTEFDYGETVRDVLQYVDVLKVSTDDLELAEFTEPMPQLIETLHEYGPHTVLFTYGDEGASVYSTEDALWGSAEHRHDGYEVDARDTTGAGDAFAAAAIAGFVDGRSVAEVNDRANAVAAMTTTAPGAMTALPTRHEVAEFREHGGKKR